MSHIVTNKSASNGRTRICTEPTRKVSQPVSTSPIDLMIQWILVSVYSRQCVHIFQVRSPRHNAFLVCARSLHLLHFNIKVVKVNYYLVILNTIKDSGK